MATNVAIQGARLGVCEPCDARQAALLAREPSAPAHSPRGQAMRDRQADWLAYFSAQLCNSLEGEWRRREGRSRVSASCQQPNNPRHLHTGVDHCKERGANESCQDDLARADSYCCGGRREVNLRTVPFCSHAGKPKSPQMLEKNGGDDETRTRDLCRDSAF